MVPPTASKDITGAAHSNGHFQREVYRDFGQPESRRYATVVKRETVFCGIA
jgi:hypothetical protein